MRARGFTLIEIMIASTAALVVVLGAFVVLNHTQKVSVRQSRIVDTQSTARHAMAVLGRDIRMAGDSMALLPGPCMGAMGHTRSTSLCPAILDAHPWRITLARNAWGDGGDYEFNDNDVAPTGTWASNPNNAVRYEFVPERHVAAMPDRGSGGTREVVIGRIERTTNPFGFAGQAAQTSVLLNNVILDDEMHVSADGAASDARFAHSLFMFQLAASSDELSGDAALVQRTTSLQNSDGESILLSPPTRFYDPLAFVGGLPAAPNVPPYMPNYGSVEIVGLRAGPDENAVASIFATTTGMDPSVSTSDIRRVLDWNRIHAVRVAFKVFSGREDPEHSTGLDLDGNPANGTALVQPLVSTYELKLLANDRSGI